MTAVRCAECGEPTGGPPTCRFGDAVLCQRCAIEDGAELVTVPEDDPRADEWRREAYFRGFIHVED
jgi:hypothetical protein